MLKALVQWAAASQAGFKTVNFGRSDGLAINVHGQLVIFLQMINPEGEFAFQFAAVTAVGHTKGKGVSFVVE